MLLIAGIYLIWNAWPKKEVLQGETIGELLEITGVLADIEPFLEKVGISKDTPLSVPPVQTTRLGIELVDGRNYQNFGLRFSKDGVLHTSGPYAPILPKRALPAGGAAQQEVEFRSQIEAFMSLNVWGDPDDISYEITVNLNLVVRERRTRLPNSTGLRNAPIGASYVPRDRLCGPEDGDNNEHCQPSIQNAQVTRREHNEKTRPWKSRLRSPRKRIFIRTILRCNN